jgi:hypothetical protein
MYTNKKVILFADEYNNSFLYFDINQTTRVKLRWNRISAITFVQKGTNIPYSEKILQYSFLTKMEKKYRSVRTIPKSNGNLNNSSLLLLSLSHLIKMCLILYLISWAIFAQPFISRYVLYVLENTKKHLLNPATYFSSLL